MIKDVLKACKSYAAELDRLATDVQVVATTLENDMIINLTFAADSFANGVPHTKSYTSSSVRDVRSSK